MATSAPQLLKSALELSSFYAVGENASSSDHTLADDEVSLYSNDSDDEQVVPPLSGVYLGAANSLPTMPASWGSRNGYSSKIDFVSSVRLAKAPVSSCLTTCGALRDNSSLTSNAASDMTCQVGPDLSAHGLLLSLAKHNKASLPDLRLYWRICAFEDLDRSEKRLDVAADTI